MEMRRYDVGRCPGAVRPSVIDQLEELRTMKSKEEKSTRRDSVFSRISSYRQKLVSTAADINSTHVMHSLLIIA